MPRGGPVFRYEVVQTPSGQASPNSIVASARVFGGTSTTGAQTLRDRRTGTGWMDDIWDLYDLVPEFHSACGYVGNLLSKAKLTVLKNGVPTTDQPALDALASLFGGPEGQEEMFRLLGINFTATGCAWIYGREDPDGGDDIWQVVSDTEVTVSTGVRKVEGEEVPKNAVLFRMWRPHARRSYEPDCPARALLSTLTESVRLSQVVASQADSRLKGNGILWVPSELELASGASVEEQNPEGDEAEQGLSAGVAAASALTRRLINNAKTAMANRESAAASIPLVVAVPGKFLAEEGKPFWQDFWTGFDEHVQSLRAEIKQKIALGMDMPPEALTGTGDMNHWGSWAVEESAIKVHSEPLLAVIVSSLTTGFLRPYLRGLLERYPDAGIENPEDYSFGTDTVEMRLRPNRSKEALELFDRGQISGATLLRENGFDPDTDSPEEQERIREFVRRMVEKTSASPDQLAALLDRMGIAVPTPEASEQPERVRGAMELPTRQEHPVRELPEAPSQTASGSLSFVPIDGIVLAAEQMVYRALERAGNRIRQEAGTKLGSRPADAYLSLSKITPDKAGVYLTDAWTTVDIFDHPHVERERLREALDEYATMLLCSQRPYTRESLARHLLLELAPEEAAA